MENNQFGSTDKKNATTTGAGGAQGKTQSQSQQKDTDSFSSAKTGGMNAKDGIQETDKSSDTNRAGGEDLNLDTILSYVKDNWRVLISELVAAGVGAYLKHQKSGSSAQSSSSSTSTKTAGAKKENYDATQH